MTNNGRTEAAHRGSLRRRRQSGSVLVELSIISMTTFAMMIGVVDFGQFLYVHQTLTERARAAVRYGVTTSPVDTTGVQNMVMYGQTTAGGSPIFGITSSNVQVTTPGGNTTDYRLVVFVTNYNYTIYSPFISGSYTGPNITAVLPLGMPYN
jgi:Flp pilus assembly protein TadG